MKKNYDFHTYFYIFIWVNEFIRFQLQNKDRNLQADP